AGDTDRLEVFDELADKIAAHTTCEEKVFYPGVMEKESSDLLHESVEEHLAVKRLLVDMLELDPEDDADELEAKLAVRKEAVSHHAHEQEEGKLFPIVRDIRTDDELAALADDYLTLYERVLASSPRDEVYDETDEAAPLPSA